MKENIIMVKWFDMTKVTEYKVEFRIHTDEKLAKHLDDLLLQIDEDTFSGTVTDFKVKKLRKI